MSAFLDEIPKSHLQQQLYWVSYFPTQMTSGYAVYRDTKKHYKEAIFQRRIPLSERCSQFIMDEQNIDAMIDAVNKERIEDKRYFQETLFAALGTHGPFVNPIFI